MGAAIIVILKIIGFTLLAVLGLFILISFLPLGVYFIIHDETQLYITISGIPIPLDNLAFKKAKKKPSKSASRKSGIKNQKPHKTSNKTQYNLIRKYFGYVPKKMSVTDALHIIKPALPALGTALKRIGHAIRIRKLHLDYTVAGTDASKTAMLYGELNAIIPELLPVVYDIFTVYDLRIRLEPDFLTDKAVIRLDGKVHTTIAALLFSLLTAALVFIKYYVRQSRTQS